MFRWDFAILQIINDLGGDGCLQEIYARLEEFYELSVDDLRETVYSGRPAYQHQVRSFVSKLWRKKGYLVRLERGCYSLTETGRKRFLDELESYGP